MDKNKKEQSKKLLNDLKNLSEATGYVKGLSKAAMLAMNMGYNDLAKELAREGNLIASNLVEVANKIKKGMNDET